MNQTESSVIGCDCGIFHSICTDAERTFFGVGVIDADQKKHMVRQRILPMGGLLHI